MEILIPLAFIIIIAAYSVKKLKPKLWKKIVVKFKK